MKLTIVIEKVKDGTKKVKEGLFIKLDSEGKSVMAHSEMPVKGSAFAEELKDIKKQMLKLLKAKNKAK
jgi:hypothetical protein